jgi:Cu/Ag efflux protein CusF
VQLPDPKYETPRITLRHERVPDFKDANGAVVGMEAMTMPFDLASADVARSLAVGDGVEAVLAVDWKKPSFRIERLARLPPGTRLDFAPKR